MLLCTCIHLHHLGISEKELSFGGNFLKLFLETEFLSFLLLLLQQDLLGNLLNALFSMHLLLRFYVHLLLPELFVALLCFFTRTLSDLGQGFRLLSELVLLLKLPIQLPLSLLFGFFGAVGRNNLQALSQLSKRHLLQQPHAGWLCRVEHLIAFYGGLFQSADLPYEVLSALQLLLVFLPLLLKLSLLLFAHLLCCRGSLLKDFLLG
mmetsp:Transcript_21463/g.34326  ORF Transcript_21463/g.34326 Transcript_21463/m.34326 type:complete len:207 (-) Transcript_21463:223-843(-)